MHNPLRSEILSLSNSDRDNLKGKRIAIIANCSWNIYNFRLNIIKELLSLEAHVYLIVPFDSYTTKLTAIKSITILELKQLNRSSINPIKDLFLLIELIKVYRKYKLDCILHYTIKPNIYGAIAARLLNIPSISVVTGLGYSFLHKGFLNLFVKYMYRLTFRYPKRVIFENKDDKDLFIKNNLVKKYKAFHVNGCGVNVDYFSPINSISSNKQLRFTFIGRLLYDKGIIEFINAASKILDEYSEIKFTIVGIIDKDNPAHLDLNDLNHLLSKSSIEFKNYKEDIRPEIAASDCIVLASYREGMPKILMEAMSMSKPILTTDTAGCRDLVEDGTNGYLVNAKDVDSLVIGIKKIIILTEEDRRVLGINGRKKAVNEFCDKLIASQITKHLASLL